MVEDKKLMANMFIEHFTANSLLGDYRPQNCQVIPGPLPKLKLNEIKNVFSRLSNKKSCGMDNIPGFFLKCFSNILAPFLVNFFNKILESNTVPSTWKIAKLTPVMTSVDNYRPVSNLHSIAKLYEICILQRMEMLDFDLLMGTSQHGFRKGHGTDSAVCDLVSEIVNEVEKKKSV